MNWDFVEQYENQTPPWGPIGYITYKRSYAQFIDDLGRTEEWHETIERDLRGLLDIGGRFTQDEIEELFYYIFNLKCCLSGRALWQLGMPTVEKLGADSLQNCWVVDVNTPIEPFTFCFSELMLGGGVGFNITPESVYSLPKVKYDPTIQRTNSFDADFIVPDNREGWVELLERLLKSYFYTGQNLSFCTSCVRDKGARIKSFGGTASGPEELAKGILQISKIISMRVGQKLRPIDCLDIMNIISQIVISGNVRRGSQIALGSPNDPMFLNSKAWGRKSIPNWRALSNNSVITSDIRELPDLFWSNYTDVDSRGDAISEPFGLLNLHNCHRFGRLADGFDYRPDYNIIGVNPCGEVPEEDHEPCNLGEIFLPNLESSEEFMRVAGLMYKVCKTISTYPFLNPKTNAVVQRNHRLGLGVSGFLQAPHLRDEQIFNAVYRHLEDLDAKYSAELGCSKSIKLTTVKPSGTLSLLAGVTPGVHPAFSKHYIRNVRFAANDPLVEICRQSGYAIEPEIQFDGNYNYNTMVVSFPVRTPDGTVLAESLTATDQLNFAKWLQTNWADNAVSVTVYYDDNDFASIRKWLDKNYVESVKSVSFLKRSNHGFVQAPMIPVSREQFEELYNKTMPIRKITDYEQLDLQGTLECETGGCPIK